MSEIAAFPTSNRPRGRWAPSPSGLLHVGSARTALLAWLSVRSRGGSLIWRLEDLDPPRTVVGVAAAALEDLAWLGLDWDEGGDLGGPFGPYQQSLRGDFYDRAIDRLYHAGRLFPCRLSRRDLRGLTQAPHGASGQSPYAAEWRPSRLEGGWLEQLRRAERPDAALRFQVEERPVIFADRLFGACEERVDLEVGDFVLKRRDGLWAYQLAVVVDDLEMAINEVVRGSELLDSTARQIQLIEALGGQRPSYAHVPMVLDTAGEKLSKRDTGLTLKALRDSGVEAAQLVGWMAHSLGLSEHLARSTPASLVDTFDWTRLRRQDTRLPEDFAAELSLVS